MKSKNINRLFMAFSAIILISFIWNIYFASKDARIELLSYGQFIDHLDRGEIKSITVSSDGTISGEFLDSSRLKTTFKTSGLTPNMEFVELLRQRAITANPETQFNTVIASSNVLFEIFIFILLPILLTISIILFFAKRALSGMSPLSGFTKSKAQLISKGKAKTTFKDVAGVDEAKEELREIVDFLKEPYKFSRLGGQMPKGVLLIGPPGTGKTLLAKAVAGEANVPFFSISGSDFVEMFVGVGAARMRDLFNDGKRNAPSIIFIDELDAVGQSRDHNISGGSHREMETTLNQLLVEMDGFESNNGVITIAATNRPEALDTALLRPGRFDRRVIVEIPDINGRFQILQIHTQKLSLGTDVDLRLIARGTPGFSGADLASLTNEAALMAAGKNKGEINMEDLESAKDKVIMGVERKSRIISAEEKNITAVHEAGHAVIAASLKDTDPLHKVTIIPRGISGGSTWQLPVEDKHSYSKEYLENRLAILMGGRCAEEVIIGQITTGAQNDIEVATELAQKMVCKWGMSDIGTIMFGSRDPKTNYFYSGETAETVDKQIMNLISRAYDKSKRIITERKAAIDIIATTLKEKEALDGTEVYQTMSSLGFETNL